MSAAQLPRDRITSAGVRGDAEELDGREGSQLILVSLKIRDFIHRAMEVDRPLGGVGHHGVALPRRGHWYCDWLLLRGGARLHHARDGRASEFARRQQLQHLQQRLRPGHGPLEVVSLSANRDGENRGAVHFQHHVFTQRLGFEELQGALPIIQRIAEATPELGLDHIMRQDVTPLRFRQIWPPS
eukprot:6946460-Prymnesium_polylepis.1